MIEIYNKHGKYGCLNNSGDIVLPAIYSSISLFNKYGLAKIEKGEKFGYIDKQGKVVVPIEYTCHKNYEPEYSIFLLHTPFNGYQTNTRASSALKLYPSLNKEITCYRDGYDFGQSFTTSINLDFYSMDPEQPLTEDDEEYYLMYCSLNLADIYHKTEKSINLDKSVTFKDIKLDSSEDILWLYHENYNEWQLWDIKNTSIIANGFEEAYEFSERLACVCKNGKYGFIDRQGKIIIPIVFDATTNFLNEKIIVMNNNKWAVIDKNNNIVVPFCNSYAELTYNLAINCKTNEEKYEWFRKSAIAGYKHAMYELAIFYQYGYGVPQNNNKAKFWHNKFENS